MKLDIRGKGPVSLTKNDFLASGGEGDIYIKQNLAFKVYHDANDMVPEGKIQELARMTDPKVIKPLDILLNNGKPCGFTMLNVPDTLPIVQLFTTAFRDRNGITPESTIKLVENIQKLITSIHDGQCLMVDVNEMNFLVNDKNFIDAFAIDTNSYQTPSYPATAIMPSVRDYRTNEFNRMTDWYSFAIISFQLFCGIHPFKGTHASYKKKDIVGRMTDGISVLDSAVKVPKAMRDLSHIPNEYMRWYEQLFKSNQRIAPPNAMGVMNLIQIAATLSKSTHNFKLMLERELKDKILFYKNVNNKDIILTATETYIGKVNYPTKITDSVILSTKMNKPVKISINNGYVEVVDIASNLNLCADKYAANNKLIVDNALYTINEGNLTQFKTIETATTVKFVPQMTWTIMPKSSKVLGGCVYQNILGKCFLSIPEPSENAMHTVAIPDLNSYRVIEGKRIKNVVTLLVYKDKKYSKAIIRFNAKYNDHDVKFLHDVDNNHINYTVLDNGMCIMIHGDSIIELFRSTPHDSFSKYINDDDIDVDMILCNDKNKAMFFKDNKLYHFTMK